MWVLTNGQTEVFVLTHKKSEYFVGRAQTDFVIKNDNSISRKHAVLRLCQRHKDSDGTDDVLLEVQDLNSRYGTYVNDGIEEKERLRAEQRMSLKEGDFVQFGALGSKWLVSNKQFITLCSSMSNENVELVKELVEQLGGKLLNNWDEKCGYLTMTEFKLTVNFICALLKGIPTVNCDYWRDLLKVVESAGKGNSNLKWPDIKQYLPVCHDSLINMRNVDFNKHQERTTLFSGKKFVFMHRRQLETYGPLVEKAGGQSIGLNEGVSKAVLIKPNTIVMQYMPLTQSQSYETVVAVKSYIEGFSKRVIPEYEIGLAIVYCCIDKYCNPDYKVLENLLSNSDTTVEGTDSVFVCNTSFADTDMNTPKTDMVVKETEEEFMPQICVTESAVVDSQKGKRKRSSPELKPLAHSTEKDCDGKGDGNDSDENLFSFNKRPHLDATHQNPTTSVKSSRRTSPRNATTNATPATKPVRLTRQQPAKQQRNSPRAVKPLPVAVTTATGRAHRTTTSTEGYLGKAHAGTVRKSQHIPTDPTGENASEASRTLGGSGAGAKRKRIAVLDDNDSMEDDLFSFGDSGNSKKSADSVLVAPGTVKKSRVNIESGENDEGLFDFGETSRTIQTGDADTTSALNADIVDGDDIETQPYIPRKHQATAKKMEPKAIPRTDNIVGWLSSCLRDTKLKCEDDQKNALESSQATVTSKNKGLNKQEETEQEDIKGVCVFKGGFAVHRTTLVMGERKTNSYNLAGTSANATDTGTGRNFKTFVKQHYKRQQSVVSTVLSNELRSR